MQELVAFTLGSITRHPEDLEIYLIEGEASLLFEVELNDEDRQRMLADDRALLEAVQAVLSASSGRQRVVLELVDPDAPSEE